MPEFKVEILTEAQLEAAIKFRAELVKEIEATTKLGKGADVLKVQLQRVDQQIKATADSVAAAAKKTDVLDATWAKLSKKFLSTGAAAGLGFKAIRSGLVVVGETLKPVQEGFDEFVASLARLGGRASAFAPIQGLAEVFKTAAQWIDVLSVRFDEINTKARTHADLWASAEKSAAALKAESEEQSDIDKDITSNKERRLKTIDREEEVAKAVLAAEKAVAEKRAGQDPVALAAIGRQFAARELATTQGFRIRREGVVADAQEQLAAAAANDPELTAEQFAPALAAFQAADARSTAARTRAREKQKKLAELNERFAVADTRYDRRVLGEQIAALQSELPGLNAESKSAIAAANAARAGLPPGVTTQTGLDEFISSQNAARTGRVTSRGLAIGGLADQQADLLQGFRIQEATGPARAQLQALEASAASSRAAADAAEEAARELPRLTAALKKIAAQSRAAANSQP